MAFLTFIEIYLNYCMGYKHFNKRCVQFCYKLRNVFASRQYDYRTNYTESGFRFELYISLYLLNLYFIENLIIFF